jgi:hypothetical protein
MSNKIGFVLSLIFVFNLFLFATDIVSYQLFVSKVDMVSINIRSMIAYDGDFINATTYVQNTIPEGKLECLENCDNFKRGVLVSFRVSGEFQPILSQMLVTGRKIVWVDRAILIV